MFDHRILFESGQQRIRLGEVAWWGGKKDDDKNFKLYLSYKRLRDSASAANDSLSLPLSNRRPRSCPKSLVEGKVSVSNSSSLS